FGNLASRVAAMIGKYFDGALPPAGPLGDAEQHIVDTVAAAVAEADDAMEQIAPQDAVAAIWRIVDALNLYITETQPWAVAKDESQRERLGTILNTAAEGLRVLAVTLHPVMPKATVALWESLGAEPALGPLAEQRIDEVATWGRLSPGATVTKVPSLFPRIDLAEG